MKRKMIFYEPPTVEVTEVAMEQGFIVTTEVNQWGNGGNLGNYEADEV